MKLLNKITFYNVLTSTLIFLAAVVFLYYALDAAIISETNEQLRKTNYEVKEKLLNGEMINYHPFVEITEVDNIPADYTMYSDTLVQYTGRKEREEFRQFVSFAVIKDKFYKVITRSSLIEKDELFDTVLYIMISILISFLLFMFYVNRRVAKKIFKPFYENLKKLDNFSLQKDDLLVLEKSTVTEFEELNSSLIKLSEKAKKEYNLLKEFTEDLSHELQTPVAVIKSKLELLLQKEINDGEIENYIRTVYQNINKLDKLNRTLLLLTKLENKDFFPSKEINLKESIAKSIEVFSDSVFQKKLTLKTDLTVNKHCEMNEILVDTLLGNLISNAIKHNYGGGEIFITLDDNRLTIKNTGEEPAKNPENYFNRFARSGNSKDSTGLGLSVAKKICDLYKMKITYTFEDPYHTILIIF